MFEDLGPYDWLVIGCCLALGFGVVRFMLVHRRDAEADRQAAEPSTGAEPRRAWHQVLGVPESAGPEEIQAAWRRQITRYHPDKVASLGPEFSALAEQHAKEITQAYEEGRRLRG